MRKIIVLNEMNKATREALEAVKNGTATEEQKLMAARHNAGKQGAEALAREKGIWKNYRTPKHDGSIDSVQNALHNVVDRTKASEYHMQASNAIKKGQDIKQGKTVNIRGLEASNLGRIADRIENQAAEGHSKINSMTKRDLAKLRRKFGGKRNATYNLQAHGTDDNIYLPTRTEDGKKDTYELYTNNYHDPKNIIGNARINSRAKRSVQQFGKEK